MFKSVLIANRGEIACRITGTARKMGVRSIAVYSDIDRGALHVEMADEAFSIGSAPAADSYANGEAIIAAALKSCAEAIHPGYGFLSENAAFAAAVEQAGLTFIGPPAHAIQAMGLKDTAKALMRDASIPVLPGYHGPNQNEDQLAAEAARIGYPILIKARAGGAGRGIRLARNENKFGAALASARQEAEIVFGDGSCILEKYLPNARHIEVQIAADNFGNIVHLFERDCSIQRRFQKLIEEAPAPGLSDASRDRIGQIAIKAASAVGYRGAGTVEFIADVSEGFDVKRCYFMEMNTRLQVEHPITEAITGVDLVEWQLRIAAGEDLPLRQDQITKRGVAIEARIYAGDTASGLPGTSRITHLRLESANARVDTGVREGDVISAHYDPLIAKLIVHGGDRDTAVAQLRQHLRSSAVLGIATNLPLLAALANSDAFSQAQLHTGLVDQHREEQAAQAPLDHIALAALTALGLASHPAKSDPFLSLRGWRQWSRAVYTCKLDHDGGTSTVELEQHAVTWFAVRVNGQVLQLQSLSQSGDGRLRYEAAGQVKSAHAWQDGAIISIHLDGRTVQFAVSEHTPLESSGVQSGPALCDAIVAPIQGIVRLVNVEPGATVKQGQPLAVMEAMKMEFTISAPRNGIVAAIHAVPGHALEPGAPLVTLKPEATVLTVRIPTPRSGRRQHR